MKPVGAQDGDLSGLLEKREQLEAALRQHRAEFTVLFTDVVGSTAYFEQYGDTAGLVMLYRHDKLAAKAVSQVGGKLIKTIGDSVMAEFPDPVSAVRAAVKMQRGLLKANQDLPQRERICLRIGLHCGMGFRKGGDLYGDVVNVAARLCKRCAPCQILASKSVHEAISKMTDLPARLLGDVQLQGRAGPEEIHEIIWTATAAYDSYLETATDALARGELAIRSPEAPAFSATPTPPPFPAPGGKEEAAVKVQPEAPKEKHLLAGQGRFAGKQFVVSSDGLQIGRHPSQNQVVIEDPEISRQHARIYPGPDGRIHLEDCGTANGTYVNDKRVKHGTLSGGDVVRFGMSPEHVFIYTVERPFAKPAASALESTARMDPTLRTLAATVAIAHPEIRPKTALLQVILDQNAVEDYPLLGERITLGRATGPGRIAIAHHSVSNDHAEVAPRPGGLFVLRDLASTNRTFVNGTPVTERALADGDLIQLGACDTRLLLFRGTRPRALLPRDIDLTALRLRLGRDGANEIHLPHPTVSRLHAELRKEDSGYELVDLNSTNGTFVNGERVSRQRLSPLDRITLGTIQFTFDGAHLEAQSDGSGVRLRARGLCRLAVESQSGRPKVLLRRVSLAVEPGEFVALLGPSGSGKTTLLEALDGSHFAEEGSVFLNEANLYEDFAALRTAIGSVPQQDILHGGLTVAECLRYAARLRLPDDFAVQEMEARVDEVIRTLELGAQSTIPIERLSSGERKRVSLGQELLSKPSLLFLDEPTAGQDPRSEMKMMQLFRRIANQGTTVVITTNTLACFHLFDKVAVLTQGRLAYFGLCQELLGYFEATRPADIFERLMEKTPDEWARHFQASDICRRSLLNPLGHANPEALDAAAGLTTEPVRMRRSARPTARRQALSLLSRQATLWRKDAGQLTGAMAPPVLLALLTGLLTRGLNEAQTLFLVVAASLWFGGAAAVREIVEELAVYRRERQRTLLLSSYLGSKLIFLAGLAGLQSGLFVVLLTSLGALANHFWATWALMWIMTVQGALIGLLVSACSRSAVRALQVFPLALLPQLLLAGFFLPLETPAAPGAVPKSQQAEKENLPRRLVAEGLGPALRHGLSPLMVSRWGLETLVNVYLNDGEEYSVRLADTLPLTLRPDAAQEARKLLQTSKVRDDDRRVRPELAGYAAILTAFAVFMVALIILALKRRDARPPSAWN